MIEGVMVTPLARIPDERGAIVPMMRSDDPAFEGFGEIYFSQAFPGVIKGWHLHHEMILHYVVVVGRIKLVVYDARPQSPTQGFKGVGTSPALVANCATLPHDPQEIVRRDPFSPDIPYQWELRHG